MGDQPEPTLTEMLRQVISEQTRLRSDLLAQGERVLNEVSSLRDDMTVTMARLDRMDATVGLAIVELRAMHNQISKIATRVRSLEAP